MTDDANPGERRAGNGGGTEDHHLLGRYAAARDEAAFAELVRRHLGFVYHVALRQCGGDACRAEDVAQTVFTDLARKAGELARRPVLAGWLYTSTRYAAAQAVRGEARRQAREREAQAMNEIFSDHDAGSAAEWERLRPAIDEALLALSERDREAVLLRFFEGRAFADVGRKLRLSEDAARMRVERALEKMRTVLSRHGVTSTSAALAAALAGQAAATAPTGLAASIAGSAMSGAAMAGAGSLAAVIAFMSASKITVFLAAAGALPLGTAIFQSSQARTAAAMLADASRDHTALNARLSSLGGRVKAAEKELADRAAALARPSAVQATTTAAAELAPEALAALAQKAKYDETLGTLRRSDPEYRKADSAKTRLFYQEEFGPLFRTMGLTPEQIGRVCDFWVGQFNQRLDGGSGSGRTYQDAAAEFWARFGPEVPGRIAQFLDTRDARNLVLDLSARTHFTDEPFSLQQAEQLVKIIANARPADSNARPAAAPRPREWSDGLNYHAVAFRRQLDWDAILAQAGPVLSPPQLDGLRGLAAQARAEALLAAAEKESAAPMK